MAKKSSQLAHELFDIYSANFHIHASKYKDLVACPLCFERFSRSAIDSGELTVEHIIPEKIGGRLTTLSCKKCNNHHGSALDSHLVRRFQAEDKLLGKGNKPLRGKIYVGDGEFTADIRILRGADRDLMINTTSLPQSSDPKLKKLADDRIGDDLINIMRGRSVKIKFELGFIELASQVAALRSSYLMMFYYFGYGYIKHKALEQVRFQIWNPELNTKVLKGIQILDTTSPDKNGVSIITNPIAMQCFFVTLNFSTELDRYWGVALPGLDSSGYTLYEGLNFSGKDARVEIETCPRHEKFLVDPEYARIAEHFWNESINKKRTPN